MPILFQMIPTSMMSEIKIKHKYTSVHDKSYEGFSRLLIEMANERTYDRRAAKGRGENDMDLDALAGEKERQHEEEERRQGPEQEANQTTLRPSGLSTKRAYKMSSIGWAPRAARAARRAKTGAREKAKAMTLAKAAEADDKATANAAAVPRVAPGVALRTIGAPTARN